MAAPSFDDAVAAEVLLALVPGIGPRLRKALLDHFGSATAALAAPSSELRTVPGIGTKLSRAIVAARSEIDVAGELDQCREHGIQLLVESAADYPQQLRTIPDPPGVLFVHGTIVPADALAVAIVGTRHATQYGIVQAERLAAGLARAIRSSAAWPAVLTRPRIAARSKPAAARWPCSAAAC